MNQTLPEAFAYEAQTREGRAVSGTINALDADEARQQLAALGLRPMTIEAAPPRQVKGRALSADDFLAFNQQLAQLTAAGLPVEHGLRLIAQDMQSDRLRRTIQDVATDMESGMSLAEAFEKHRSRFPAMYSELVDAGVRSGRLPGVLLNLSRHMELVNRLHAALWRACAYPMMIIAGMLLVLAFMSVLIIPQFEAIFKDFGTDLPQLTKLLLGAGHVLPAIIGGLLIVLCAMPLLTAAAQRTSSGRMVIESFVLALPLIGSVVRRNLVARWCDALRLGVDAGLDLPGALTMAGDSLASPALQRDSTQLAATIVEGSPVAQTIGLGIIPATVPAVIDLSSRQGDLSGSLASLSDMYQQEAEWRLNGVNAFVAPVLLMFIGVTVGFIVLALLLPLVKLITNLTG